MSAVHGVEVLERPRRSDALPEMVDYRDTGCEVSPSCLACPLERCKYDEPQGLLTVRVREQANRAVQLHGQGLSIDAIAATIGVGRRTVYRYLQDDDLLDEPDDAEPDYWEQRERELAEQDRAENLRKAGSSPREIAAFMRTTVEHVEWLLAGCPG